MYNKPQIIENNELFEGIFALESGQIQDWDWSIWWANHNSGSHSEMEIRGKNNSNKSGNFIVIYINFIGKGEILSVANASKATSTKWNSNSITLTYNGVFNPGEEIVFGLPSIIFSDTGDGEQTTGSYHLSNGDYCNCLATDAFTIEYYMCI